MDSSNTGMNLEIPREVEEMDVVVVLRTIGSGGLIIVIFLCASIARVYSHSAAVMRPGIWSQLFGYVVYEIE